MGTSAILLLAAGLTVFLPYFDVERRPDVLTGEGGHTYHFTGVELMSGSYKRSEVPGVYDEETHAANLAEDGAGNPFLITGLAFLGLVLLPLRSYGGVTLTLVVGSIIVLIAGCGSTFDIEILGPGPLQEKLGIGFWLGVLFATGAAVLQAILWRRGPRSDIADGGMSAAEP